MELEGNNEEERKLEEEDWGDHGLKTGWRTTEEEKEEGGGEEGEKGGWQGERGGGWGGE